MQEDDGTMLGYDEFKQLEEKLGSKYLAINYVSTLARKLKKSVDDCISESEAITWALTGEKPEIRKKTNYIDYSSLDEVLCYVDDVDVCESVRMSYMKSLKEKHLLYRYKEGINYYQKARVRILVRMVWYNMEGDHDAT